MLMIRPPSWLGRAGLRAVSCLLPTASCLLLCCGGANGADISTEVEKWVGKQVAELLKAEMGLTSDRNLTDWVQRIGKDVSSVSPRQDLRYDFAILDLPDQNAFALPGGYIFVTLGLIRSAASDEEVASVLAHEVAHVSERHFTKYLAASLVSALGLQYVNERAKATWTQLARAAAYLAILRLSRRNESQADRWGLRFAYEAGYDPEGLVEFLVAIGGESRSSYFSRLFSTHPATYDRIVGSRQHPFLSDDNYEALLARARTRRRHFELIKAAVLYEKAIALRPEELAPRLELASLAADRGLLLSAASAYDALGESYPAGKEEAEALRREAGGPTPSPPPEEQISPARAKFQALTDSLSSSQREIDPLLKKNSAALKATAGQRQVNSLMDSVLLLEPNFWDMKRLALLAQAKAIVQTAQSAFIQIGQANFQARSVDEEWGAFSRQLQAALASPRTTESLPLLLDKAEIIAAEGALAASVAKGAAQNCSEALHRLDVSLRALTPLLLALLDAGMQKDAMSLAAAASLEALALKAGALASQAERLATNASQDCASALLPLRQWQLELKFAQASPRARDTLVKMLAYRLGIGPEAVRAQFARGLGYGQAAVALAIARAKGVGAEEVLREGEACRWAEVAEKWGMRMDALLVPLDLLSQSAKAIAP